MTDFERAVESVDEILRNKIIYNRMDSVWEIQTSDIQYFTRLVLICKRQIMKEKSHDKN